MSNPDGHISEREHLLYERLAACLEADGDVHENACGQIFDEFPEFSDELQDFFDGQAVLNRLTAPLRYPPQQETRARSLAETVVLPTRPSLPDYEVFEEIARGGMGVVYRARHKPLGRTVALKMIRSGDLATEDDLRRFESEARRVARLDHPNIVQLYEVGSHGRQHFFTMRLMEGGTLAGRIAGGGLSPRDSADVVSQISRALHHAHQHGVLHRDVKPGNILFDGHGLPQIADFGLAKQIEPVHTDAAAPVQPGSPAASSSQAIAGTPMYMAPEQIRRDEDLSTAADIYSLGAVLYELLTGQPPFRAATTYQTLIDVVRREPKRPKLLNPRIDRDLETICLSCLDKRPESRYRSADALADDLDRWLRGEPILARPCSSARRVAKWARRSPALAALAGLAVAAIVGGGAVLSISNIRVNRERVNTQQALEARTEALDELRQVRRREQRLSYLQAIALADRELSVEQSERAEAVLEDCPPELRGWEWHYLKVRCHAELSSASTGIEPSCVAVHPRSGSSFVGGGSLGAAGRIAVFDADLNALYEIEAHEDAVTALAIAHNGRLAASASRDGAVRLWRVDAGNNTMAPLATLEGRSGPVWSLSFSPNGDQLASAGADAVVRLWDADSGELLRSLQGHQRDIWHVTFSPDGRQLASAGGDGAVRVWDLDSAAAPQIRAGHAALVRHVAFSHDGRLLLSAGDDNTARVWSVADGREVNRLLHPSFVTRAAFLNSRQIATASVDGNLRLWDAKSGKPAATLHGHDAAVWDFSLSADGQRLASISEDGTIKSWLAASARQLSGLSHGRWLTFLKASSHSQALVGLCSDGTLQVWDADGDAFRTVTTGIREGDKFCVSGDGNYIATCDWSDVKVLRLDQEQPVAEITIENIRATAVALSGDGSRVAVATADGRVSVWSTRTSHRIGQFTLPSRATAISLDPSGDTLVVIESGQSLSSNGNASPAQDDSPHAQRVSIWQVLSGRRIGGFSTENDQVAFTADGSHLSTYGNSQTAELWSVAALRREMTAEDSRADIVALALGYEGGRIFAGHADGTVTLWDFATGHRILTLRGHEAAIAVLASRPDGRLLAADVNGVVKTWDAAGVPSPD